MHRSFDIKRFFGLALPCMALIAGCASTPPPTSRAGLAPTGWNTGAAHATARWHSTCFRMPFDAAGRPVWGRDLLLADRVLAPLLDAHRGDITLWRFHRRAANDGAGHQFSLLLYTSDATYAAIQSAIERDPIVASLRGSAQLTSVRHACRAEQAVADIAATSDPSWDPAIQRTWPHFIMGVSASWLALVHDLAVTPPADAPSAAADPVAFYSALDRHIAKLWTLQGQHAYLHHLSGLYGYKPLRIETWMQF